MSFPEILCMSETVSTRCTGLTVPMNETGIKLFTSELVNVCTFAVSIAMQALTTDWTFNQLRAANSAKCALVGFAHNSWNFIAAMYFLGADLGFQD